MELKDKLTLDDFKQMYELEKQFYSEDCITTVEDSFLWYKHYDKSFLVAVKGQDVIGFMCLFPIRKHICDALERGCFNDADLEFTDIICEDELNVLDTYTLFLSCVVVDEVYRGCGVLRLLLNGYKVYYEGLRSRGIRFDYVVSDNVTEAGLRFSKGLGLEPLIQSNHGSVVVKGTYEGWVYRIRQ